MSIKYSVTAYGAEGNGITNDAPSIQKAIDECSANGGGIVNVEGGKTYYASSIILKANVTLNLEKGSKLFASRELSDYVNPNDGQKDEGVKRVGTPVTLKPSYAFIYAKDADNISITGEGTIDGNAYAFVERKDKYYVTGNFYPRPTLVYVEHCNHITFEGIRFQNAPFWTLHPAGCEDVLIQNIRILNDLDVANSDGIDPDHCKDVRILGCHIQCADDCICLKTTAGNAEYGPTRDVIISDCTLMSTSAALKIGTEGVGNFENVIVSNCAISGTNRGISIQIRDGGNVRNVSFSNIMIETRRFADCFWGCAEAIVMTTNDRDDQTKSGTIENIRFENITTNGENGIFISGNEKNIIKDISFRNVRVSLRETSKWEKGKYDLRPIPDVDKSFIFQKSPAVFLRFVKDAYFENCKFVANNEKQIFANEAMLLEKCEDVSCERIRTEGFLDEM